MAKVRKGGVMTSSTSTGDKATALASTMMEMRVKGVATVEAVVDRKGT
jgi:hypothetical protein